MKHKKVSFSYRVQNERLIQRYDSSSIRRFKNHTRTIKWQNSNFNAYLKINYGSGYHNDGYYENKKDLLFALEAFADLSITKYLYG